jgi:hypothetical protein
MCLFLSYTLSLKNLHHISQPCAALDLAKLCAEVQGPNFSLDTSNPVYSESFSPVTTNFTLSFNL